MEKWILSSSVLIVGVLVLRQMLRGKISLRLQYALWLVVLIRLLMPGTVFHSSMSVQNWLGSPPVEQEYIQPGSSDIHTDTDILWNEPANTPVQTPQNPSAPVAPAPPTPWIARVDWGTLARMVWVAGMAVMALVFLGSNLHFLRSLRKDRASLEHSETSVPVYVSANAKTPCLVGLFRPVIYVTGAVAEDREALRHVIHHELTHLAHFDHVSSVLRCTALCLHWYNPLVWIAAKVSRADGELACDEGAIARLGEGERIRYGQTLIRLTCRIKGPGDILLSATTMTGSKSAIKERIQFLAKRPRTLAAAAAVCLVVVCILVGCTFTGPMPGENSTDPVETTTPADPTPTETTRPVDIVLSDLVTLTGDPGKADVPEGLHSGLLAFAEDQRMGYGCDSAKITSVQPMEKGEKIAPLGLYLYEIQYRLRSETEIHDKQATLIFCQEKDGSWKYVGHLISLNIDELLRNGHLTNDMIATWGGQYQAAAVYIWEGSPEHPSIRTHLRTIMDAMTENGGMTISRGDITYAFDDGWAENRIRSIHDDGFNWSVAEESQTMQYAREDAVTLTDRVGNYLRVYDSPWLLVEICHAGEEPVFWKGNYMEWYQDDGFSMYLDLFYRAGVSLNQYVVEADDCLEALEKIGLEMIPYRNLKVPEDNPSYALEVKLLRSDIYVESVSEDGLSACGYVSYAIRPPEYDLSRYGNVEEGSGALEGWIIFNQLFSVRYIGNGLWQSGNT